MLTMLGTEHALCGPDAPSWAIIAMLAAQGQYSRCDIWVESAPFQHGVSDNTIPTKFAPIFTLGFKSPSTHLVVVAIVLEQMIWIYFLDGDEQHTYISYLQLTQIICPLDDKSRRPTVVQEF